MPKSPAPAETDRYLKKSRQDTPIAGNLPMGRRRFPANQSRFFVRIFGGDFANLLVCVLDRRDYVRPARPFTQVDCPAAVATEGKLRVATLDGFLADRTAKFQSTLARHRLRVLRRTDQE